jgi:hypothetical protein
MAIAATSRVLKYATVPFFSTVLLITKKVLPIFAYFSVSEKRTLFDRNYSLFLSVVSEFGSAVSN